MIDWSRGYACEFSLIQIDPRTWTTLNSVNQTERVSINRDGTDEVPLLETASINVDGNIEDGWYRVMMRATQDDVHTNEPLGTFRMEVSSRSYFGSARITTSMNGYSVLKPCNKMKCHIGEYAPKGGNIGQWAVNMLSRCTPAPVRLGSDERVAMTDFYVFDSGTDILKAVWIALDDVEWCIQIDGEGVIWVLPKPDKPKKIMDIGSYGILQPKFDNTPDRTDTPNVYRINYTSGDKEKEIEIVNSDPNSPISTVSRGYRVEEVESSPSRIEGETYENYGKRQLVNLSSGLDKWNYTREYIPDLRVFDVWDCRRHDVGMVGNARILSQSLTCERGVTVSEKVGIEVKDYAVEYVDLSDD